jgi:hypothetical protein
MMLISSLLPSCSHASRRFVSTCASLGRACAYVSPFPPTSGLDDMFASRVFASRGMFFHVCLPWHGRPGRPCPVPACSGQPRPAREDSAPHCGTDFFSNDVALQMSPTRRRASRPALPRPGPLLTLHHLTQLPIAEQKTQLTIAEQNFFQMM